MGNEGAFRLLHNARHKARRLFAVALNAVVGRSRCAADNPDKSSLFIGNILFV